MGPRSELVIITSFKSTVAAENACVLVYAGEAVRVLSKPH